MPPKETPASLSFHQQIFLSTAVVVVFFVIGVVRAFGMYQISTLETRTDPVTGEEHPVGLVTQIAESRDLLQQAREEMIELAELGRRGHELIAQIREAAPEIDDEDEKFLSTMTEFFDTCVAGARLADSDSDFSQIITNADEMIQTAEKHRDNSLALWFDIPVYRSFIESQQPLVEDISKYREHNKEMMRVAKSTIADLETILANLKEQ